MFEEVDPSDVAPDAALSSITPMGSAASRPVAPQAIVGWIAPDWPMYEPDEPAAWHDVPDTFSLSAVEARGEREHPVPRFSVRGLELACLHQLADDDGTLDPVAAFAALIDLDPLTLTEDFHAVELIAGLARLRTWIEARENAAHLAFARRGMGPRRIDGGLDPGMDGDAEGGTNGGANASECEPPILMGEPGAVVRPFVSEELAPRLGTSTRTITQSLGLASELLAKFPAAQAAHAAGWLDTAKARILVRECDSLDAAACVQLEQIVLPRAAQQTPTQFRASVRRQVAALDPAAAEERHATACERRWVQLEPAADGMAWLSAFLPAADALMIHTALTAAATRAQSEDPHDLRTMDQLRADLLVWPFASALRTGVLVGPSDQKLARSRGERPHIQVTVSLETLMGESEVPAHLRGYGPIPASMARRIAAEGTWRRLVIDPLSGAVLDVGTTTYTPPIDLLRHVHARDRHCRFPGCSRPAIESDVDHVVPFPHGPTAHHNLASLCRRHHRFKHHDPAVGTHQSGPSPAVDVEQPSPGTLQWRLPSGHEYTVEPEPYD